MGGWVGGWMGRWVGGWVGGTYLCALLIEDADLQVSECGAGHHPLGSVERCTVLYG